MTQDQVVILLILASTMALFIYGRWRHDVVALASLLSCVLFGLVPPADAFAGFGHPAVITVACVLVLSYGLQNTGVVDALARTILPTQVGPMLAIAALTGLGAALSAFMNNVGAMALLMPIAIQMAARHELPPGKVLMPLSFGTILGGMTTLIGTPPNLIVSGFRAQTGADSFGMFDFTPVGLAVAGAGILFCAFLGWRLVPSRERKDLAGFDTGTYLTEARVTGEGKVAGRTLQDIELALDKVDAQVIGLVLNDVRVSAPDPARVLQKGDILIIEAEPQALTGALSSLGLALEEAVPPDERDQDSGVVEAKPQSANEKAESTEAAREHRRAGELVLQEFVVMPTSSLIGRSASDIRLRGAFGLNLLAIARQGRRSMSRLRSTKAKAGDVLLMQGPSDRLSTFAAEQGCVPLAGREITIPDKRRVALATVIVAAAIGGAAFGLLPAAISFAAGVVAFMALRIVPLRRVYESIDWPVVILLGALIPVAGAMASTGAADLLAQSILEITPQGRPAIALALVLIIAMTLSDFMNNAATAAVVCPIAISAAGQLDVNPDSFLMAVAIGASCAFLTPIGHQNNTLILGPGGLRFGDYWRLGLPLEVLVVAVSVPLLQVIWPL
jgi:di/tricarboxylate transporter